MAKQGVGRKPHIAQYWLQHTSRAQSRRCLAPILVRIRAQSPNEQTNLLYRTTHTRHTQNIRTNRTCAMYRSCLTHLAPSYLSAPPRYFLLYLSAPPPTVCLTRSPTRYLLQVRPWMIWAVYGSPVFHAPRPTG